MAGRFLGHAASLSLISLIMRLPMRSATEVYPRAKDLAELLHETLLAMPRVVVDANSLEQGTVRQRVRRR